ncbi:MAG: FAD-dependent oxidoreductase, partial [Deltaproteobacteria bacterium]|nr:FAD-dependent oxidoreductase [Deltaproteobacteria bacterium]
TGQPTGFRKVGGLRVARTPERMEELNRSATLAMTFGLPMTLHDAAGAVALYPDLIPEGILGAANLPTDGFADPAGITMALAQGARTHGATLLRHTPITAMTLDGRGRFVITTPQGVITSEIFVNCAGMWAPQLGRMLGVSLPIQAVQHQYLVGKRQQGEVRGAPTLRDPDRLVYYKAERGEVVMGGYEPNPVPWSYGGVPEDFGQQLLPPDFDHFEPTLKLALQSTPNLEQVDIVKLINGPEGFTPDGNPVLGEVPEVRNYFVAAGFNAFGIASGGGAGKMIAEWILHGRPSLDLWELDILRFSPAQLNPDYVRERTLEAYAGHYAIAYPHKEYASCRPLRTSPLYRELLEQGAVFGEKAGWERPNWFAPPGTAPRDLPSFGRPHGFEAVGAEHRAVREAAGLFDQTSFSKFQVEGPGALAFLQRLTDNQMDKPPGAITYTQMLTETGGIACDLTVTRLGDQRFYLTTGTAFGTHDLHWMRRHLPAEGGVYLSDVTSARSCLNLCGPNARRILETLTSADLSNGGFPFLTAREIPIGKAPVLALRVTYVGELGWELHVPTDYAVYLYHLLRQAGRPQGLVNAGYRAIESLRLEKGYRYWSADITPDTTPYEAGLGFCVKLDKGDFIGRQALLKHRAEGPRRRLCTLTVADPSAVLVGKEAVLDGTQVLGVTTSAGYGYSVQKNILFAYLPIDYAQPGTQLTVEALRKRYPAQVEATVLYDPEHRKVRL